MKKFKSFDIYNKLLAKAEERVDSINKTIERNKDIDEEQRSLNVKALVLLSKHNDYKSIGDALSVRDGIVIIDKSMLYSKARFIEDAEIRTEKLDLRIGQVLMLSELEDVIKAHINNEDVPSIISEYGVEELLSECYYPFFYEELGEMPENIVYFDIIQGGDEEAIIKITDIEVYYDI